MEIEEQYLLVFDNELKEKRKLKRICKTASIYDKDFEEFIKKFTSDIKSQKESIKFSKEKGLSEKEWTFIAGFIDGIDKENGIVGGFVKQNESEYTYSAGYQKSDLSVIYYFRKIDNKWYLVEYEDIESNKEY